MVCRACRREIKDKAPVLVPNPMGFPNPSAYCGGKECRPPMIRQAQVGWGRKKVRAK